MKQCATGEELNTASTFMQHLPHKTFVAHRNRCGNQNMGNIKM